MPSRPALPVSLYVAGRPCLVVGEGAATEERVSRLTLAGAEITRAPPSGYRAELLAGLFMVFCCDAVIGPTVSRDARERGVLVYVLDCPELSDLAMPALVRRGPLQLAISTDGQAPALARRLREELERVLDERGAELDQFINELVQLRATLAPGQRRDLLYAAARRLALLGRIQIQ